MSHSVPSRLGRVSNSNGTGAFYPRAVDSFEEAGLNPAMVEGLVLKFLVEYRHGSRPADRRRARVALWPVSRLSSRAQEPADRRLRQFGIRQ